MFNWLYYALQWNLYQCLSFENSENSCGLRGWWAWGAFCGPALPGGWFQHSILAKMSLNMIWSLKHGFHHPCPWWRLNSKLVCFCLWVGSGVKFECHVCWGWACGLYLRWSVPSPYWCSACTGIGCFGGCFWVMHLATHERINMIKRVQQNENFAMQVTTSWNELKWHEWQAMNGKLFFVSVGNYLNGSIICVICSCRFKFWKLRLSLNFAFLWLFCPRLRKGVGREKNLWQESPVTKSINVIGHVMTSLEHPRIPFSNLSVNGDLIRFRFARDKNST